MLPEQVWDGRPPTGRGAFAAGEGTFSATPLAWAHAQFFRLAWSIDRRTDGRAGRRRRLPLHRPLRLAAPADTGRLTWRPARCHAPWRHASRQRPTVRPATAADRDTLRRLEVLESGRPLTGRVLVAEDDRTVIAALSLDERRAIVDPFEPSAAALVLLRAWADALLAQERRPSLRERLRARLHGFRHRAALPASL